MIIRIDTSTVRQTTITAVYTAHAIGQGYSLEEARTRANLWFEFESLAHDRSLMTVEAMRAGGESDYRAVERRTLSTEALQAMVDTLRATPIEPPPVEPPVGYGWLHTGIEAIERGLA